jgi:cell pole-organizing protein PopZ
VTNRPNEQQEPSMEEILSSIRRIIADETSDEDGQDAAGPAIEGADHDADSPSPDADDEDVLELTEVVREEGEVIELDRGIAPPHPLEGPHLRAVPDEPAHDEAVAGGWDETEASDAATASPGDPFAAGEPAEPHAYDDATESPMDIRDDDMQDHQTASQKNNGLESLISDRTAGAATGAFARLSQAVQRTPPELAIADGSGRTVEQFAEDMLRPMLREWLDENLGPLVERIVQKEIQRIVRRAEEG